MSSYDSHFKKNKKSKSCFFSPELENEFSSRKAKREALIQASLNRTKAQDESQDFQAFCSKHNL